MLFSRKQISGTQGVVATNLAVLLFGFAGVLGKLVALPSPLIVLGRTFFAATALLVTAYVFHIRWRPARARDLGLLVAQGVLLAIHWTAFFQSINVSNVAVGLLSFSSFPLFTAVLEPLILRRRADALQVVAALLVLPGVFLLVPTLSLGDHVTQGVAWGVLAGATFALLSVTNRWLGMMYPTVMISLYQDGIAALVLLPTLLLVSSGGLFSLRDLAILLALGLVCTALAHSLFIEGLRGVTAQLASLFAALEPVWGILFAFVVLHEIPSARTWAGGGIILAATLLPAIGHLVRRSRAIMTAQGQLKRQ